MKNSSMILAAALLMWGCGSNGATVSEQTDSVAVVDVGEDEEWDDEDGGLEVSEVSVSEDGRMRIETGYYPGYGGTAPDYWSRCTIVNDKGDRHTFFLSDVIRMSDVHSIKKDDGSTYYIVGCYGRASSWETYEWLQAYRIVGDTVKQVNVIDGGAYVRNPQPDDFEVAYSSSCLYRATLMEGYDWILEYDAKTRCLYVPISVDYEILDRYKVWQFNGKRFVCLGEKPHKGIHHSLANYNRLIVHFVTQDYTVRVDSLDNGQLRYASWKKPKNISDKPDLVLTNGCRHVFPPAAPDEFSRLDEFIFRNKNIEYIVDYEEITPIEDGLGEFHEYLLVKKGSKVITKQERITL